MSIIRVAHRAEFTVLPNDIARHPDLPLDSIGLLVRLLSRPPNWQIRMSQLQAECRVGRERLRRMIRELRVAGYIRVSQVRRADGTYVWDYAVYDTPQSGDESTMDGLPVDGSPTGGPPTDGQAVDVKRIDVKRKSEKDRGKKNRERCAPTSEPDAREHTFAEFVARCREQGEQPIPADHPVFDFAAQAGIPVEWTEVAWAEFCRRYRDNPKVHRDWRDLFFRTVRENWLRIWYVDRATGEVRLTSEGLLLQRAMDAEREEGAA